MKHEQIRTNRTAVLYARVSSEEQEKEGYSIPAQIKALREYAERKGISVLAEYLDVETAKKPGRPGFRDMVAFFRTEKRKSSDDACLTLLVEKTDRLYRNLKDYITIDELGIDVHFAKEGVVLSPDSHSSEKLMHGIKVLMAKNYVDNLGEEVRKGMLEKAQQGIPPNKVPLGYINTEGPDKRRIVVQNPQTAPVMRILFEEYATGRFSLESLATLAKQHGLFAERGEDTITATLHANLTNPFYYGEFRFRGKLYKGQYEPLISKELWDRVQRTLHERATEKPRQVKNNFAFQNFIRCGHCGCALIAEIKKERYVYYHCTYYKGKCPEKYVREEVLEEKFTKILGTLRFDDEVLAIIRDALHASHADETRSHKEALDRLRGQYDRLRRWIDTAYEDRLDGRLSAAQYDERVKEWRGHQDEINEAIAKHQRADRAYLDGGVALLELASGAAELFARQPPSEKRRLLDFVLSNSTWKNGELTPEFRQPFDMIADAAILAAKKKAAGEDPDGLHQNMLPDKDSNLGPCD